MKQDPSLVWDYMVLHWRKTITALRMIHHPNVTCPVVVPFNWWMRHMGANILSKAKNEPQAIIVCFKVHPYGKKEKEKKSQSRLLKTPKIQSLILETLLNVYGVLLWTVHSLHAPLVMLTYPSLCLVKSLFLPMLNHCTVKAAIRSGRSQCAVCRKWPFSSLIVPVVCNLDSSHEVERSPDPSLPEKGPGCGLAQDTEIRFLVSFRTRSGFKWIFWSAQRSHVLE